MKNEYSDVIDLERFMRDAVSEILRHEDPSRFMDWARRTLPEYFNQDSQIAQIDTKSQDQLATVLARMVWNSTPLPGNDFRPKPLPVPGRNDRCDCGSGRKYKQCCALAPHQTHVEEEAFWHILADILPEKELNRALERKRIPRNVITTVAERFLENGKVDKAVTILESIFAGKLNRLDPEVGEYAFDLLMDAYDRRLNISRKKDFIERILATAPRGTLRSVALQRKATMLADQGELPEAWEAFSQAMRDDPESPSLCILELQLLLVENRLQQAKDRALFWHAKMTKLADKMENPQRLLDFLRDVMEDPETVRDSMRGPAGLGWDEDDLEDDLNDLEGEDPELLNRIQRLRDWISAQVEQPVPEYRVYPIEHFGEDREDGHKKLLLRYFSSVGLADDAAKTIVSETMQALEVEAGDPESMLSQIGLESCRVTLPADPLLAELEPLWMQTYPVPKLMNFDDITLEKQTLIWEEGNFDAWMGLLEDHPEAFGSIHILEDLLFAMLQLSERGVPVQITLPAVMILLQRITEITQHLELGPEEKLPWFLPQNRSMLRGLARSAEMILISGNPAEAERLARLYLRLNPTDDQDILPVLCSALLRLDKDDEVLRLAEENPESDQPEIAFGPVIALFRQGEKDEADAAMVEAMGLFPMVPEYLFEPEIGEPDEDDYEGDEEEGFTLDDAEVAWNYVHANRALWESVPGLMEWGEEVFDRECEAE